MQAQTAQTDAIAALTRAHIATRVESLQLRERELTERAAAMYASGRGAPGFAVPERDRRTHEMAKKYLNGAGGLLAPLKAETSEGDVMCEREGVRLALSVLQAKDFELAATEAAINAVALSPKFLELQRAWLLAAAHFLAVEKECGAFLKAAGGDVDAALPWSHVPLGRGAGIDLGYQAASPWAKWTTVDEIIDGAIAAKLISRGDLDRARKVG